MVEQLGQVDLAREQLVDLFVDLDQRERARANVEQVVVDVDVLAGQRVVDDRLELALDLARCDSPRTVLRGELAIECLDVRVELTLSRRLPRARCVAACRSSSSGCA